MQLQLIASPRSFLHTLCWLRAAAILGQIATLVIVHQRLHIGLPLVPMTAVSGMLAASLLLTVWRLRNAWQVTELEVTAQLLVDISALTALLYMSGGYTNPFASLYLIPVTLAAVGLTWRYALSVMLGCLAAYGFLMFYCMDLVYAGLDAAGIYKLHCVGAGINFAISAVLLSAALASMAGTMQRRDREMADLREATLRREYLNAMGLLAAGAAHELSTPLATMAVVVGELKPAQQKHPAVLEALELLSRQIQLCKEKLGTLLQAAGQARSPDRRRVSLRQLLQETLDAWRVVRPDVNLDMQWEEALGDPWLSVDEGFSQALTNLLNNAAEASTSKGSNRVVLTVANDARALRISIDDEGPGLSREVQQQAGKAVFTTKAAGFGLGLVISHVNLNRLGGELTLTRRPEGGTRTTILMPLFAQEAGHG
ncbi:MAG TPA: ATP-binding protein [Gammaproteobacteria bacterium]|nr:ATP-binding protein [Gammaproteobacteria bacterium]